MVLCFMKKADFCLVPYSVAWSGAMAGSLFGRINTLLGHMAYELVVKPYYFVQPQA